MCPWYLTPYTELVIGLPVCTLILGTLFWRLAKDCRDCPGSKKEESK